MSRISLQILNSKTWLTADGEVLIPSEMSRLHVSNCLTFLYKRRDWLLYNSTPELIEECATPDEFFEKHIKNSVIWNEFLNALKDPKEDLLSIHEDMREGDPWEDL